MLSYSIEYFQFCRHQSRAASREARHRIHTIYALIIHSTFLLLSIQSHTTILDVGIYFLIIINHKPETKNLLCSYALKKWENAETCIFFINKRGFRKCPLFLLEETLLLHSTTFLLLIYITTFSTFLLTTHPATNTPNSHSQIRFYFRLNTCSTFLPFPSRLLLSRLQHHEQL